MTLQKIIWSKDSLESKILSRAANEDNTIVIDFHTERMTDGSVINNWPTKVYVKGMAVAFILFCDTHKFAEDFFDLLEKYNIYT